MAKSIFTAIIVFASLAISAQGIDFVEVTWQEALEKAKEEKKLLFVDSYAKWCGPCKRMAKYEFVKPEVGEIYNSNFVNLKLDMESKNGRTFDSQYPVSAYPTMFFLNGDGEVVKKVKGGKKAEQLISMAKAVLRSHDTSGEFRAKYVEGDRSYETVYGYVEALNKVGKPSLRISNDYIKSNPDIKEEQLYKFYHIATVDADSRVFDLMTTHKNDIVPLVSEKAYNEKVKSACIKTIAKAIEYETESLFEEAIAKAAQHLTKDAEIFTLESKIKYYSSMRNGEKYGETAKEISKIYLKEDPMKVKPLIGELQKKFKKDEKLVELSVDLAKKYFKKTKSTDGAMVYAKSLMAIKKYDKATDVLNKGIKEAEKNGESTKPLEMLIKVVEKEKA